MNLSRKGFLLYSALATVGLLLPLGMTSRSRRPSLEPYKVPSDFFDTLKNGVRVAFTSVTDSVMIGGTTVLTVNIKDLKDGYWVDHIHVNTGMLVDGRCPTFYSYDAPDGQINRITSIVPGGPKRPSPPFWFGDNFYELPSTLPDRRLLSRLYTYSWRDSSNPAYKDWMGPYGIVLSTERNGANADRNHIIQQYLHGTCMKGLENLPLEEQLKREQRPTGGCLRFFNSELKWLMGRRALAFGSLQEGRDGYLTEVRPTYSPYMFLSPPDRSQLFLVVSPDHYNAYNSTSVRDSVANSMYALGYNPGRLEDVYHNPWGTLLSHFKEPVCFLLDPAQLTG